MVTPAPRDRERILRVWRRAEQCLQWYAEHSAARKLGFKDREGWFLLRALGALLVLANAAQFELTTTCRAFRWGIAGLVVAYVLDSALVNTSIVFVTRGIEFGRE